MNRAGRLVLLLASLSLLLPGCTSLIPSSPRSVPGAAVLWFPAGYEDDLALVPGLAPPGSLAEFQLRTGQRGSEARRAFASQFPGAESAVEAYEREWADCFASTLRPGLRRHANQPLVWQILAADARRDGDLMDCYRSSRLRLQQAIVDATDPQARDRLQNLLFIQEIQFLRTKAIHGVARDGLVPAVGQLVRLSEGLPANSQFRPWLDAQAEAESRRGDLAGREWYRLGHDEQDSRRIQPGKWLVLPDPTDCGLAAGWQNQWPTKEAGQPQGTPFADWLAGPHGQDAPIIWLGSTVTVLPPNSPAATEEFVANLRSVHGTVRAYLDGELVGESRAAPGQPQSCRFPLAFGQPGGQPRVLAIRIAAHGEPQTAPILWHEPWLMVVPAKPQPAR